MSHETSPAPFVHTGLPAFMRASLHYASRGGASGYESAGFNLGRTLETESPHSADDDDWRTVLDAVDAFLEDDERLASWLRATFPRILAAVPPRRVDRFIAGVRRGREEASC